jgi:hypothetical protein
MEVVKKTVLPVFLATLWISLSEFIRNEFLLRDYWHSHYAGLGLSFPSEPVNGAIWGLWSLLFAILIYINYPAIQLLAKRFHCLVCRFCADVGCHRQHARATPWPPAICHSPEHFGNAAGRLDHHKNELSTDADKYLLRRGKRPMRICRLKVRHSPRKIGSYGATRYIAV